ncbi:MAG TPA: universal stress protein [Nitrospiraceae bacterium]|nr:universal stress protein [Nitrospiraceae bacterium]
MEAKRMAVENEPALITRILFATDFSACARHAEQHVAFLAAVYRAAVTVLHVLEIYEGAYVTTVQDQQESGSRLADVARRLIQPAAPVAHQQRAGIPDAIICDVAEETQADLIVLGTHGRTGLRHILLGSTAERVLTMAPCPVLIVRLLNEAEREKAGRPIRLTQVAVPIDFSDCSMEALEYGARLAKDVGASVTLLHILEPLSYGIDLTFGHAVEQNRQQIAARLKLVADEIQSQGVPVRAVIRGGVPADSILDYIHSSECDLVVMGTQGRRGIAHVVKGSVAEAVLRRAPCPVLAGKHFRLSLGHRQAVQMT